MAQPLSGEDVPIVDADDPTVEKPENTDDPNSKIHDDTGTLEDVARFTGWPDADFEDVPLEPIPGPKPKGGR
jgi:hypothetical protein